MFMRAAAITHNMPATLLQPCPTHYRCADYGSDLIGNKVNKMHSIRFGDRGHKNFLLVSMACLIDASSNSRERAPRCARSGRRFQSGGKIKRRTTMKSCYSSVCSGAFIVCLALTSTCSAQNAPATPAVDAQKPTVQPPA